MNEYIRSLDPFCVLETHKAASSFRCFLSAVNVGGSFQLKPRLAAADVMFHRLHPVNARMTDLPLVIKREP